MKAAKGMKVGYIRVSSTGQNVDRQVDGFNTLDLDKVFTDKVSGATTDRPELKACLEYLRENDTLYIYSMDRLARNLIDLQCIVNELTGRGVSIKFIKEQLTFEQNGGNPMNTLLLQVMGAFAEFERSLIKERQMEGIQSAKTKGVKFGRKAKLAPEQVAEIKTRLEANPLVKKVDLMEEYSISRATLYRVLSCINGKEKAA
ncbi:ResR [Desulforapulum autotrophicum HRM2]|uniref:ResR n=1 Tax=Desulforapulum autotrophicum (strain ATCC 43914 / DSM 3382 / VKM B-1955 / HRM2) TaxID=177437 RepID=C0QB95_DESAH|nr:recombinase family protein [Desulforapulum autotrophicum]ACN14894.1 ResR [Desulforapulum autotrophicum HRM2]